MVSANVDMKQWKDVEVNRFKKILESLDQNSREYQIFKKGIESLESISL